MPQFLFSIADTFEIKGRGLVICADKRLDELEVGVRVQIGSEISIRSPDGSATVARITGIEIATPRNPNRSFAFLVDRSVTKDVAPVGSQIWTVAPS